MKTKFKLAGKGETKTTITVEFEAPSFVLTREETMRKRENLRNEVFDVLRKRGYDVREIREVK